MNKHAQKTILVAPLDWGFGHATRMIPLVRLLSEEYNVVVAAPKKIQHFFDDEAVKVVLFPGYNIRYYRLPLTISLVIQAPKIIFRALLTVYKTRRLVKQLNPEIIIADNRPFVKSKIAKSVYITHQLTLLHGNKNIQKILNYTHRFLINRFDACWIPDSTDSFFAGDLSQGKLKTQKYFIGALSRFVYTKTSTPSSFKTVCILSGPLPNRTLWANQIKKQLQKQKSSLIIGAIPGKDQFIKEGEITLASHLNDELFQAVLIGAEKIFSRSGYTTIMDLYRLRKNAFLYPTPGQQEQEYLAQHHHGKYFFNCKLPNKETLTFDTIPDAKGDKFCKKEHILKLIKKL